MTTTKCESSASLEEGTCTDLGPSQKGSFHGGVGIPRSMYLWPFSLWGSRSGKCCIYLNQANSCLKS